MGIVDLEIIVVKELTLMVDESVQRHMAAEQIQDKPAAWVALGEMTMCQHLLQFYLDMEEGPEQYFEFLSAIEDALEYQKTLYTDARQAKDWHTALLAMGRIRLVKTLFVRLADPDRQIMQMIPTEEFGAVH